MVPYLLMKCLQPETALKDIKRLWQIRNCLLLLDYDDPSADPTKLLLLRCYMQPMFLKADEVCNESIHHYVRYCSICHQNLIIWTRLTLSNRIVKQIAVMALRIT